MRGGQQHAARLARGERVDDDALLVDGHRDRLDSPPLRLLAVVGMAGVLEREDLGALGRQHAQHEIEPLREAGADDDPLRVGDRSPHAAQVAGEDLAQTIAAAGVAIPEGCAGAVRLTSRIAHIQSRRGSSSRSGTPRRKSIVESRRGRWIVATGAGASRAAPAATRVPEPVRELK